MTRMSPLPRMRDSEDIDLIEKRLDEQRHDSVTVLLTTWHWYTRVEASDAHDRLGRSKSIHEVLHRSKTIRRYLGQRSGHSFVQRWRNCVSDGSHGGDTIEGLSREDDFS